LLAEPPALEVELLELLDEELLELEELLEEELLDEDSVDLEPPPPHAVRPNKDTTNVINRNDFIQTPDVKSKNAKSSVF
jgi:hypothetical protein